MVIGSAEFPKYVQLIVWVLVAAFSYLMQIRAIRRMLMDEVRSAFAGSRAPFCFNCGFDLQRSNEPLCPECGLDTHVMEHAQHEIRS